MFFGDGCMSKHIIFINIEKMENTQSWNYKHIRICIHRFRAFNPWQNTVEWYINWKQVLCIKDKFQFWTHIKLAYAQHPLMCESHNYGTFVLNAHVFSQGKWLNINDKLSNIRVKAFNDIFYSLIRNLMDFIL